MIILTRYHHFIWSKLNQKIKKFFSALDTGNICWKLFNLVQIRMKGLQYDISLNSVQLIFVVLDFVFKTKRKKEKTKTHSDTKFRLIFKTNIFWLKRGTCNIKCFPGPEFMFLFGSRA